MGFKKDLKRLFHHGKKDYVPILEQQTDFICRTSTLLLEMFMTSDREVWKSKERQIKACEAEGDALLNEIHEQLSGIMAPVNNMDIQSVAMAMDDCLDVIKDTAKAVLIYGPDKLDSQLEDLAHMANAQSLALHDMIPLLSNIKKNIAALSLGCDRVTELEHAADDAYEDYIGFIFKNVDDAKELIKYKNLAEMLENATDAHKKISDNVRRMLLGYMMV
jgi:uncharacterized protein Yka (UPF0111/DUF47 family)